MFSGKVQEIRALEANINISQQISVKYWPLATTFTTTRH